MCSRIITSAALSNGTSPGAHERLVRSALKGLQRGGIKGPDWL